MPGSLHWMGFAVWMRVSLHFNLQILCVETGNGDMYIHRLCIMDVKMSGDIRKFLMDTNPFGMGLGLWN